MPCPAPSAIILPPVKALLLYPEFPDTFWSFKHALKFIRKTASLPPLGLLTVAAMLPRAWEKRLVDLNVRRLKDRDLQWADVVSTSLEAGRLALRPNACAPPRGRAWGVKQVRTS